MKRKVLGSILLLLVFLCNMVAGVYAMDINLSDITVSADADGLKVVMESGDPTSHFVNHSGLMPGDTIRRTLKVTNTLRDPCFVNMRTENIRSSPEDFVNIIRLKLTLDGSVIYDGVMGGGLDANGRTLNSQIELGEIPAHTTRRLEAEFHFPGKELDNAYQKASAATRWIFGASITPPASSSSAPSSGSSSSSSTPSSFSPSSSRPVVSSSRPSVSSRPPLSESSPSEPASVTGPSPSAQETSSRLLPAPPRGEGTNYTTPPRPAPQPSGGGTAPAVVEEAGEPLPEQPAPETTDLADQEIALGGLARKDVWSLVNLILGCVATLIAAVLILSWFVQYRCAEEEEPEEEREAAAAAGSAHENDRYEEQEEQRKQRSTLLRWLTVFAGLVPGLLFLLLEDLTLPVALVNRWTILIALCFLVHVVLLVVFLRYKKRTQPPDSDDDPPPQTSGSPRPRQGGPSPSRQKYSADMFQAGMRSARNEQPREGPGRA